MIADPSADRSDVLLVDAHTAIQLHIFKCISELKCMMGLWHGCHDDAMLGHSTRKVGIFNENHVRLEEKSVSAWGDNEQL
jgi:hypothetical protein